MRFSGNCILRVPTDDCKILSHYNLNPTALNECQPQTPNQTVNTQKQREGFTDQTSQISMGNKSQNTFDKMLVYNPKFCLQVRPT